MAGPGDVHRAEVALDDRAVHVRVEQVEAGRGPPVAEQPRLDVLERQRLAQQRVVAQIDLADGEVVRRAPPGIEAAEVVTRETARSSGEISPAQTPRDTWEPAVFLWFAPDDMAPGAA